MHDVTRSALSPRALSCAVRTLTSILTTILLLNSGVTLSAGFSRSSVGTPSEFTLLEEQEAGTLVGCAKDNTQLRRYSEEILDKLRFSFRQSTVASVLPPGEWFDIDERTGDIRTRKPIDREAICGGGAAGGTAAVGRAASPAACRIVLDVTVRPLEYFQIIRVIVNIQDINDNSPRFPEPLVALAVLESTPVGTRFNLPPAVDADGGTFGVQSYHLAADSDLFQLFQQRQADDGRQQLEVGLRLVGTLDRETAARHRLTVVAVDGGVPPRSGSVDVEVDVLDSNDNAPRFDSANYEVEVVENSLPRQAIVQVHASDPDEGDNGIVRYALADHSETAHGALFRIDESTGEVFLRRGLDRESRGSFRLTITATDRGFTPLTALTRLLVTVKDTNDNSPRVTLNGGTSSGTGNGKLEVLENADTGSFVAYVTASDEDAGSNGKVDCYVVDAAAKMARLRLEIVPGTDVSSEYKLLTAATFDRELTPEVTVTLTCSDRGSPSLTTTLPVTVHVTDVNDHSPRLAANSFDVELDEGNEVGVAVVRINASDEDSGLNAELEYSLQPMAGTPERGLTIDARTGVVTAEIRFDHETRSRYDYLIKVCDQGLVVQRSVTAQLTLRVRDVNDEGPRFDRPAYYFTVVENSPPGAVVGEVLARDRDSNPRFAIVGYGIADEWSGGGGTWKIPFEVDYRTGKIITVGQLDREKVDVFRFSVVATDGVSNSSVPVTVYIEDENDNSPTVVRPPGSGSGPRHAPLTVTVPADSPVGTLLTRVEASDADAGANAALTFAIANGNDEGRFAIDAVTGALTTAKKFSAPHLDKIYRLVVTVNDGGEPSKFAVVDVTIYFNGTSSSSAQYVPDSDDSGSSRVSSSSAAGSLLSDERFFVIFGMICGVVVVGLIAALVCCLVLIRRTKDPVPSKSVVDVLRPLAADGASDRRTPTTGGGREGSQLLGSVATSSIGRQSLTEGWVAATGRKSKGANSYQGDWSHDVNEVDREEAARLYTRTINEIRGGPGVAIAVRAPSSLPDMAAADTGSLAAAAGALPLGRCRRCNAPCCCSSSPALSPLDHPSSTWRASSSSPESVLCGAVLPGPVQGRGAGRKCSSRSAAAVTSSGRSKTPVSGDADSETSCTSCVDSGLVASEAGSSGGGGRGSRTHHHRHGHPPSAVSTPAFSVTVLPARGRSVAARSKDGQARPPRRRSVEQQRQQRARMSRDAAAPAAVTDDGRRRSLSLVDGVEND